MPSRPRLKANPYGYSRYGSVQCGRYPGNGFEERFQGQVGITRAQFVLEFWLTSLGMPIVARPILGSWRNIAITLIDLARLNKKPLWLARGAEARVSRLSSFLFGLYPRPTSALSGGDFPPCCGGHCPFLGHSHHFRCLAAIPPNLRPACFLGSHDPCPSCR